MKISTQLFVSFLISALLFVGVVVGNYQLSQRVLRISQRVTESQLVSSYANQLYRLVIDMETGYRGYLLSNREESLTTYYEGERRLDDIEARLRHWVPAGSPQMQRLREFNTRFTIWHRYSQRLISEKRLAIRRDSSLVGVQGMAHGHLARRLYGKSLMDRVRVPLSRFLEHESARRASQGEKLREAIEENQTLSILLTVAGLGLALAGTFFVTRSLSQRINRQVDWATRLAQGDYAARMADNTGDELTFLSLALDKMADGLTSSIAQLEARNRELDQFAYIVSHDLKAPLRGIESVSRWIEDDLAQEKTGLPPHIKEFLGMMRQRVGRMESLIGGILSLSRVGRATDTREEVDVAQLLREIAGDLSVPVGMQLRFPEQLPVLVTTRTHLQQVFQNLISNAIKYHDHPATGTITVTWRPGTTHHVFAVTDDGPGIAAEYHERIFQIFQTLQERDSFESTGIGLTIVKKIVERHGGTITVASAEGQGATFSFTWPR